MQITVERQEAITVARVSGEVGEEVVNDFAEQLHELTVANGAALIVDLSKVPYLNSNGLAALIHLVTRSRLGGGRVALASPSPFVREVLEITRLDTFFEIHAGIPEAVSILAMK